VINEVVGGKSPAEKNNGGKGISEKKENGNARKTQAVILRGPQQTGRVRKNTNNGERFGGKNAEGDGEKRGEGKIGRKKKKVIAR